MKKRGEECKLSALKVGQKAKVLKLTEENKKVKILKPQNEDPFYYWNM